MRRFLSLALLAGVLPLVAHAAAQTVLGSKLLVKDFGTATRRKIVLKAKETGSTNTVVGNPVATGATLTISAYGGTHTAQTFNLAVGTSAATGRPFWSGDTTQGYRYKDTRGENGPVKAAQIKGTPSGVFQIKAAIDGKLGSVTVLPPNAGTFGCGLLTLGGGDASSDLAEAERLVTTMKDPQFMSYCHWGRAWAALACSSMRRAIVSWPPRRNASRARSSLPTRQCTRPR